jgi:hypothetical protein
MKARLDTALREFSLVISNSSQQQKALAMPSSQLLPEPQNSTRNQWGGVTWEWKAEPMTISCHGLEHNVDIWSFGFEPLSAPFRFETKSLTSGNKKELLVRSKKSLFPHC